MEALQLDRPYVVGESMGGWIAAEMAALRPDKIGRLALVAPLGLWRDEAPIADMFGVMAHEMVPFLFRDLNCPAAQTMLGLSSLISDKDDRSQEQIEMLIGRARGARTAAKFLFPIPENGLERRLWRISAPTLIVWGADDRFAAPSYADIFAQRIRGAHLEKIPSVGHLIALERPDALAETIVRWGRNGH
jgi:pimeloyl-ACP methyl ester carboxylesterase